MDKDFMLNYFNKAVQPEWEELLKTPRYQPAASKRDAIERVLSLMSWQPNTKVV